MAYDTEYRNVAAVRAMVDECPVMLEFGGLSSDVKDLLFDAHEHIDAMVGYADWYVQRLEPPNIYDGAFLSQEFWTRWKEVSGRPQPDSDSAALQKIGEAAQYCTDLARLMFD